MKTSLIRIADSIPTLIQNTHLNVSLHGWPAALASAALFGSCVAIYAIRAHHSEATYAGGGYSVV